MRLSLVTFAVALYPVVSSSSRIAFHQLQKSTGDRIKERKVAAATGDEVASDEIVKGYEYEKGRHVIVEEDDLAKIRLETKKTIELIQFFQVSDIDPVYYDKAYYVVPDGAVAEEAYVVVREALAKSGQAALGRVVLSGRERLTAVIPKGNGFALHTLNPYDVVRKPNSYFADITMQVTEAMEDEVAVAQQLIARKTAPFDPKKFVDRYEVALKALIEDKIKGGAEAPIPAEVPPANVVNLMDALKRSLGEGGEARSA